MKGLKIMLLKLCLGPHEANLIFSQLQKLYFISDRSGGRGVAWFQLSKMSPLAKRDSEMIVLTPKRTARGFESIGLSSTLDRTSKTEDQ